MIFGMKMKIIRKDKKVVRFDKSSLTTFLSRCKIEAISYYGQGIHVHLLTIWAVSRVSVIGHFIK